jgi:hypothetical protein
MRIMANVKRAKPRTNRSSDASQAEGLTGRLGEGYEHLQHSVAEYPGVSVMTVFVAGFGIGLVLGCALTESSQPSSSWYDRAHAEKFGRNVLDSIAGMVPEALANRFRS